jgi:hypothetical protein
MMFHQKGNYNKWGYNNTTVNVLTDAQQEEMDVNKRRDLILDT